ncbi:unnamed protein product [Mytilus coruscus]|uniref:G-protein coupled receptors family 1 profile domain-containing protein n=1 Tax=Mytilus coruscus TaxID=42192 RepID=A0A6J8AJ09_MYTCO|nr:unnamed protein product [Mytilus coruscus]
MARPFELRMDTDHALLQIFIGITVLAYIAVVFNIIVFVVLCRKNLLSPATILMQGLAISDGLTAFFAYGLEPLFQMNYKSVNFLFQSTLLELKYPLCGIYVHFRYLSSNVQLMSLILTTCIGVQKCIALKFPIWTKCYLTNGKATGVCLMCFVISLTINLPRHLGLKFSDEKLKYFSSGCTVEAGPLVKYGLLEHVMTSIVITSILCLIMTICTGYIVYRLKTNTFKGRQTMKSKQERRSIIMVLLVLVIFLLSELPKMFTFAEMFRDTTFLLEESMENELITLIMDERFRFSVYLQYVLEIDYDTALIFAECKNIFTMLGCISNFVIYVSTSQKLRNELKLFFQCKKQQRRH